MLTLSRSPPGGFRSICIDAHDAGINPFVCLLGLWFIEHAFAVVPAQAIVARHIQSLRDFPPRQRPGSFSDEQALEKLRAPMSDN